MLCCAMLCSVLCYAVLDKKAGRVSEALDLLDEMVERGRKPDKVVVNNVLAACARDASNYWKHAKALFEVRVMGKG